jgi:hypothetical protein
MSYNFRNLEYMVLNATDILFSMNDRKQGFIM